MAATLPWARCGRRDVERTRSSIYAEVRQHTAPPGLVALSISSPSTVFQDFHGKTTEFHA
jgi:hypothetical protein